MFEIPPAKNTDVEDVVWGLQTADTLWKRGEKIDALVWLRRAAQAAGEANDDDRALELARSAAELTDRMAELGEDAAIEITESMSVIPAPAEGMSAPPPPFRPSTGTQPMIEIGIGQGDDPSQVVTAPPRAAASQAVTAPPETEADLPDSEDGRPSATSVPPAEMVHAGMFDPWSERPSQISQPAMRPPPSPAPSLPVPPPPPSPLPAPRASILDPDEEIVTSVRQTTPSYAALSNRPVSDLPKPTVPAPRNPPSASPASATPSAKPPIPTPPRAPPPLPPRARQALLKPAPSANGEPPTVLVSEPPAVLVSEPPTALVSEPPAALVSEPPAAVAAVVEASAPRLDLDSVEAFSDLPDDARAAFATAAQLHSLAEGEEIGAFALAYVVTGAFDVSATMLDAPAVRLVEGAVLRSRGTTEENVPIRLLSAKGQGVVATWSDASVEEAFRTCPWVEEDLRSAADRVQTLVGVTIGPLGERLDASIRDEIISRLALRPLIPNEIVVQAGEPVPGLLLVGIGELELVKDDVVTGVVGSGEFLFPMEVIGNGFAPVSVRAGAGGALVLFGDRRIAQELLVTCPPLLEVFAGM